MKRLSCRILLVAALCLLPAVALAQAKEVQTAGAPAAIGTYSQGVLAGGFLFAAGQIPLDPATGQMVEGGMEVQARRCLDNLRAVARAAGLDLAQAVKVTVYLTDLADFPALNTVFAEYFSKPYPARATVQVAALPKGARLEIEAVFQAK